MALYAVVTLVSAFLLFQVQPVIAKIILPWFGGSAAVWSTCLMFFQVALLAGYLYAHALTRYLRPRAQIIVHIGVLLVSATALPIYPGAAWKPATASDPIGRIVWLLAVTVGLPYFALSTTGPLLQVWYARSRKGAMPYWLYALSNAGSVLALWSYPLWFEPLLTVRQQAMAWSVAYGVFVMACAAAALRAGGRQMAMVEADGGSAPKPRRSDYALWLLLPACASTLLLAVTSHLTQNVAPIPLLWIVPLSVYLLSFILCFARGVWYRRGLFLPLLAAALAAMAWASLSETAYYEMPVRAGVALFAFGLFVCCMVCHGELARLKPHPRYLTQFYLAIAAGGASGGLLVGLAAPLLFDAYYELPIGLVATATLAVAAVRMHRNAVWQRGLLRPGRLVAAVAMFALGGYLAYAGKATMVAAALLVLWVFHGWKALRRRWIAFGAELAVLLLAGYAGNRTRYLTSGAQLMVRNFYGGLRVHDSGRAVDWDATRSLTVGIINHGEQFLNPARRGLPTMYFGPKSGIGLAIRAKQAKGPIRVGVIGLGTGTIAAYGRPDDYYRYYELNPLVVSLSTGRTPQFTFLADCQARHDIVTGDGRLALEREASQNFDVLAVDAFSSEAVPLHLLTREAMELYARHLKPDGILAVNVSNRFVELEPVVDGQCRAMGKTDRIVESDDDDAQDLYAARWMLVSASFDATVREGSREVGAVRKIRLWTDDYSNLAQILK